jgi:hypothetical protein
VLTHKAIRGLGVLTAFPPPHPQGSTASRGPRPPHFSRFRDHKLGRTPLDEWPARRRDLYLTTHNTHNRQTSMPPGGIRTHNPSKRTAVDPRLKLRDHRYRLKTCPSVTLSTTNPIWTNPGSNRSLRVDRPATNRLSHDTATDSIAPYILNLAATCSWDVVPTPLTPEGCMGLRPGLIGWKQKNLLLPPGMF